MYVKSSPVCMHVYNCKHMHAYWLSSGSWSSHVRSNIHLDRRPKMHQQCSGMSDFFQTKDEKLAKPTRRNVQDQVSRPTCWSFPQTTWFTEPTLKCCLSCLSRWGAPIAVSDHSAYCGRNICVIIETPREFVWQRNSRFVSCTGKKNMASRHQRWLLAITLALSVALLNFDSCEAAKKKKGKVCICPWHSNIHASIKCTLLCRQAEYQAAPQQHASVQIVISTAANVCTRSHVCTYV